MTSRRLAEKEAERAAAMAALGVTRLARVTGLDRTGVEVACAIRPGGHVLQVCNGKGETSEEAARGALGEAAELWAAEHVDVTALRLGSMREMRERFGAGRVWGADALGSAGELVAPELWTEKTRLAWCEGRELFTGEPLWLPAQAVHCLPAGSAPLGPALLRWTTNGMAAHPERWAALLHALLEVAERDQLARVLPRGWTGPEVKARLLEPPSVKAVAPRTARWAQALEERGFGVFCFDLVPARKSLELPLAGVLLFEQEGGPVPLAAGYACRLGREEALLAALLEAAQSRLTDIHGAREDVAPAEAEGVELLRAWCVRARPRRDARQVVAGVSGGSVRQAVRVVLERLHRAGHTRAAVVDLPLPAAAGLHAVKVVVPGLRVSTLL